MSRNPAARGQRRHTTAGRARATLAARTLLSPMTTHRLAAFGTSSRMDSPAGALARPRESAERWHLHVPVNVD